MKTENAKKARKIDAATIAAREAAKAAEAAKATTKAEAKAEGKVTLSLAQVTAQDAMVAAAISVDGASRKAAMAINAVYSAGVHTAFGLSLAQYVTRTLTAADVAKATVYYLRDIGCAYAALGTERANLFPMEGLRQIASAAKGERAAIESMATDAQSGDESVTPSLANCRKAAKGNTAGKSEAQMIEALAKQAMKYAEDDHAVAMALLDKAARRIKAAAKAAEEAAEEEGED